MSKYQYAANDENELAKDIAFVGLPHVLRLNVGDKPVHKL